MKRNINDIVEDYGWITYEDKETCKEILSDELKQLETENEALRKELSELKDNVVAEFEDCEYDKYNNLHFNGHGNTFVSFNAYKTTFLEHGERYKVTIQRVKE